MSGKKINNIINKYLNYLSHQITVHDAFLFGSAARGQMKRDSDIDLIVISKDFNGMQFMSRLQLLSKASWHCADQAAMDIIGYTPREFAELQKVDSPNIRQLLKEGRFIM